MSHPRGPPRGAPTHRCHPLVSPPPHHSHRLTVSPFKLPIDPLFHPRGPRRGASPFQPSIRGDHAKGKQGTIVPQRCVALIGMAAIQLLTTGTLLRRVRQTACRPPADQTGLLHCCSCTQRNSVASVCLRFPCPSQCLTPARGPRQCLTPAALPDVSPPRPPPRGPHPPLPPRPCLTPPQHSHPSHCFTPAAPAGGV